LKEELIAKGHKFESETDSEVAAHLVTQLMSEGLAPDEAAKRAVARLTGAYSIAMIFKDHEGLLVGGAPRCAAGGGLWRKGSLYRLRRLSRWRPFTNRVTYLEEGDVVVIKGPQVAIFDAQGRPANREIKITSASAASGRQGRSFPFHGQGNP
jgi:glucosamine--fructose-6-phosphate aminotransferase (isomerizing)